MMFYLIIILLLILSAFFSGSEISLNACNKIRLRHSAEEGNTIAQNTLYLTEHYTTALCTILIGNNLVNIGASAVSTILLLQILGEDAGALASFLATLVMTVIILIFGEIVPKILCRKFADVMSRVVSVPIRILTIILFPVVFLILSFIRLLQKIWKNKETEEEPEVSEEELSTIIDTVEEEGVIDEEKSELLQSTLEFPDTTVEEVMTPRKDTVFLNIEDDLPTIFEEIDESRYSRLPVYRDDVDTIIGVLHLNHYYKFILENDNQNPTLEQFTSLLLPACFIHKTMKLPAAMNLLRKKKTHIGIVIDEFGGTLGVVTMEDILEELVGDIWDENDEVVTEVEQTKDNHYEVTGDMNIDDFLSEMDVTPPQDFEFEYSTVGGLAIQELEAEPHTGDSFDFANLTITVLEMDEMRVTKLGVEVHPLPDEEEDES